MPLSQLSPGLPYNFPPIPPERHDFSRQIRPNSHIYVSGSGRGKKVANMHTTWEFLIAPLPPILLPYTRLLMCRSGNIPCFASHPPQQLPFKKPWRRLISVLGQVLYFIIEQELDLCFNRFFFLLFLFCLYVFGLFSICSLFFVVVVVFVVRLQVFFLAMQKDVIHNYCN